MFGYLCQVKKKWCSQRFYFLIVIPEIYLFGFVNIIITVFYVVMVEFLMTFVL